MIRNFLVRLLDRFYREPRLILKYYRPLSFRREDMTVIFMVDGRMGHGGMFDRLKGIISTYAIAKSLRVGFRINFTYPFKLEKYLEPNEYDWQLKDGELHYGFPTARPLIAYGEFANPSRLWQRRRGQTHIYYGYDSLDKVNAHFGTNYDWGTLYRELFRPTERLQQYIDHYRQDIGHDYFVVHTRFLNLLGDKMEIASINPTLSAEKQKALMAQCFDTIVRLKKDNDDLRLMIASDSMRFISYVLERMADVYVVPGTVKHIDTASKTDDAENIKMFLDYYLIASARRVYSVVGPGMWKSAFPEYAAKIGGVPFERIEEYH